jgi:hypothetical protein
MHRADKCRTAYPTTQSPYEIMHLSRSKRFLPLKSMQRSCTPHTPTKTRPVASLHSPPPQRHTPRYDDSVVSGGGNSLRTLINPHVIRRLGRVLKGLSVVKRCQGLRRWLKKRHDAQRLFQRLIPQCNSHRMIGGLGLVHDNRARCCGTHMQRTA